MLHTMHTKMQFLLLTACAYFCHIICIAKRASCTLVHGAFETMTLRSKTTAQLPATCYPVCQHIKSARACTHALSLECASGVLLEHIRPMRVAYYPSTALTARQCSLAMQEQRGEYKSFDASNMIHMLHPYYACQPTLHFPLPQATSFEIQSASKPRPCHYHLILSCSLHITAITCLQS